MVIIATRRWFPTLCCIISLILTGCWDRVELDRRSFVLTVGVDMVEATTTESSPREPQRSGPERVRLSVEIPLFRALRVTSPPLLTPELEKPAFVASLEGGTLYSAERQFSAHLGRDLYWGHTKALVVGEEYARHIGFAPLMDFFTRDFEFDRRFRVLVAEGEAERILSSSFISEEFIGSYIEQIMKTVPPTAGAPSVGIRELEGAMYENGNLLLPRVAISGKTLSVNGAAVIKHGRMVGWLTPKETQWAAFVRDEVWGGWVMLPDPEIPDADMIYSLRGVRTHLRFAVEDGVPTFYMHIRTEGEIFERVAFGSQLSPDLLRKTEEAAAKEIKEGILHIVDTMQNRFMVDVLGLGQIIRRSEPKLWEKLKDDWDEIGFRQARVHVDVDVSIRRIGTLE